jgi:hypothetical protein
MGVVEEAIKKQKTRGDCSSSRFDPDASVALVGLGRRYTGAPG